jgi:hypothetical protein
MDEPRDIESDRGNDPAPAGVRACRSGVNQAPADADRGKARLHAGWAERAQIARKDRTWAAARNSPVGTKRGRLMGQQELLESIPLWLTYVGTVVIVLLSIYAGSLIGRHHRQRLEKERQALHDMVVTTTIGLLAFILAFTFSLTTSRFHFRQELLLHEVNAIEMAFLRADLIPEPYRSTSRALLREYVGVRVRFARHPAQVREVTRESDRLERLLWQQAAALKDADVKNTNLAQLFVDSLSAMFGLETQRITVGSAYGLPWILWATLFVLTILSMLAVGYHFGMSGKAGWLLLIVLSLAFSVVILLTVELDRSGAGEDGLIRISPQPLIDLQQNINEQMAEEPAPRANSQDTSKAPVTTGDQSRTQEPDKKEGNGTANR